MAKKRELILPSLSMLGEKEGKKSEVFAKYGLFAGVTDLTILAGYREWAEGELPDPLYKNEVIGGYYTTGYVETRFSNHEVVYVDTYGRLSSTFIHHAFEAIRPVLKLNEKLFQEVISNKKLGYNGTFEVEYGEYPQYVASDQMQQKLEKIFNSEDRHANGLIPTGKYYVLGYDYCENEPKKYLEYVYKGKRYIRIKSITDSDHILSNGVTNHYSFYNYWVEISPVVWQIDEDNSLLISKKCLLSQIVFSYHYETDFSKTDIYQFMNKYMLKDLFTGKRSGKTSIENDENDIEKDVNRIIRDINIYKQFYCGNEDIDEIIEGYLAEYNNGLESIKQARRNNAITLELSASLELAPRETLYSHLIINLDNILNKLKLYYDNNIKYLNMIDFLNALVSNNKEVLDKIDSDFKNDYIVIIETILSFLDEPQRDEISRELTNIMKGYSKEIREYLDSLLIFSDNREVKELRYDNLNELELLLRKDIHNTLIKLSSYVNKKDVIKEVTDGVYNGVRGVYKESNNTLVNIYLNAIYAIMEIINTKVDYNADYNYYIVEMKKILDFKLDYNSSYEEIFELLTNVHSKLYKLEMSLEEELKMDEFKVRIKK